MIDNNIIATLWQIVSIIFDLTIIVFFLTLIFSMISSTIENQRKKKAAKKAFGDLQANFEQLMDTLGKEEQRKENTKSTKKLDKKNK